MMSSMDKRYSSRACHSFQRRRALQRGGAGLDRYRLEHGTYRVDAGPGEFPQEARRLRPHRPFEDVAALAAWLASAEASFITGQVWTVGGGRMAKLSLPM